MERERKGKEGGEGLGGGKEERGGGWEGEGWQVGRRRGVGGWEGGEGVAGGKEERGGGWEREWQAVQLNCAGPKILPSLFPLHCTQVG